MLSNAVQHGDPRKPIYLTARAADDNIEVRVANFGRPIPAVALQSIFEPLVRLPTAGEEVDEQSKSSLGLGLFIVREIVAGHGGSVAVQSSEQAGTSFTIRLPRGEGTRMKEPPTAAPLE